MTVQRVRYRERQPLRADDLRDEQEYRLAAQRRHHIGPHRWGVIAGLELSLEAGYLIVQPGAAVDGYGRLLIVPEVASVPPDVFETLDEDEVDVWLVYGREPLTLARQGRWACGPGQHDRWREEARLRLSAADTSINPRCPPGIPEEICTAGFQVDGPDDPAHEWPVYLGRIVRTADYPIRMAGRPYAGLTGEQVNALAAQMQIGSEQANDRVRFAVRLASEAGALVERLTVQRDETIAVHGDTTLTGRLKLHDIDPVETAPPPAATIPECKSRDTGQPEIEPVTRDLIFEPVSAPPEQAAPWQIYRTRAAPEDADQLRLEIAHPGSEGDPTQYKCVIGQVNGHHTFTPCLTVTSDCQVIVHGNLELEATARLIESPIDADPRDPRFAEALENQWVGDMASAAQRVETHYTPSLEFSFTQFPESLFENETLNYTVTVSNAGAADLFQVHVWAVVALGDEAGHAELISDPFDLGRLDSPESIATAFDLPPGFTGQVTVVVTVLALRTSGQLEQVTDSRTAGVFPFIG